jgi:hypothetical protein
VAAGTGTFAAIGGVLPVADGLPLMCGAMKTKLGP